ncbi:MAG: DNA-3-methyladenine glycosylase 2 family protein [Oscillospiraceae bacterium]|nr:DNA-3-methyladenine glycosylase 2 family protein [Oscillospiraceae bacterium]
MRLIEHTGEVELIGAGDFDPSLIFECGQCFRWNAGEDGAYTGVALGRAARVRREGGSIFISGTAADFEDVWRGYFDLELDYESVRNQLSVDTFMKKACAYGAGIRIMRQDKWEALCSFIISQCNNIPRIKKIIESLCSLYGDRVVFEGGDYCTFPAAERIAALSEGDLAPIRCGYRAEYILGAANAVASGALDLEALSRAAQGEARSALKALRGVGDKVADCVLLYGLHMLDSFPLDVWMKRAVAANYGSGFDPAVFAPYAGIAQQYMFHYTRSTAGQ